jgi:phosphonate transport system permease protein
MNTADITLPSKQYKRKVTIFSIAVVVVSLSCVYLNFNPIGFFTEFHFVRDLLGEMFPPNYRVMSDNSSTGYAILQTLSMAFLGTV